MRDGWTPRVRWTLVVLAMVGLVACHGTDQPTTMPTPSPSRSASASPSASSSPSSTLGEQTLVDEAIAALTEYLALANEVENDGGRGWEEKLKPWWGSDEMIESGVSHFSTLQDLGWHTEGTTSIAKVGGYVSELDTRTVSLSYCLDATQGRIMDADGHEVADVPERPYEAEAIIRLAPARPEILTMRNHRDRPC